VFGVQFCPPRARQNWALIEIVKAITDMEIDLLGWRDAITASRI
jgi:hypothetical protein